jgi:formylglycine-generating enzyme required for sulfatase activity
MSNNFSLKTITIPEGISKHNDKEEKVEEFQMCETCVTWDDWDKYIEANPDKDIPNDDAGFGKGQKPVINISWLDIQDYIKWLNEVTGEEYDLPTEIQWEYACRGGTTTDYYTGDTVDITQANFFTEDFSVGQTTDVKSYVPNPFGLYDMIGNVYNWVKDEYK